MIRISIVVALVAGGCGSKTDEPPKQPPITKPTTTEAPPDAPPPKKKTGPRIEFGECADPEAAFESGVAIVPEKPATGGWKSLGCQTDCPDVEFPLRDVPAETQRFYRIRNRLHTCYEDALAKNPTLNGPIDIALTIRPSGKATDFAATGVDEGVASCFVDAMVHLRFAQRPEKLDMKLRLQLVPPKTFTPRHHGTAPTRTAVNKSDSDNPLRAAEDKLAACVATNKRTTGALIVDLSSTGARAKGDLDTDAQVASCVEGVAKTITSTEQQRCSFAFGEQRAADGANVVFTATAITWTDGTELAKLADVKPDDEKPTIDYVRVKTRAFVDEARGPKSGIAIVGPVVIRPLPATPLRYIWRVAHSIVEANGTFVFPGGDTLPLAPHVAVNPAPRAGERRSIFVAADKVWIGVPHGQVFTAYTDDKQLADAIAALDKAIVVELSGAPDVTYERFATIRALVASTPEIVEPNQLGADASGL